MQEIGKIVEGKVTGITKFGAFVELEDGSVGMVHISEVSPTYVNDISEHLKEQQKVNVKILNVGDDGKISLSIKKALPPQQFPKKENNSSNFNKPNYNKSNNNYNRPKNTNRTNQSNYGESMGFSSRASQTDKSPSFEDMLSKFIQTSDEKISVMKRDNKVSRRGGARRSDRGYD